VLSGKAETPPQGGQQEKARPLEGAAEEELIRNHHPTAAVESARGRGVFSAPLSRE